MLVNFVARTTDTGNIHVLRIYVNHYKMLSYDYLWIHGNHYKAH